MNEEVQHVEQRNATAATKVVEHVRRFLPRNYRLETPVTATTIDSLPIDSLQWFALLRALEKDCQAALLPSLEAFFLAGATLGDLVTVVARESGRVGARGPRA